MTTSTTQETATSAFTHSGSRAKFLFFCSLAAVVLFAGFFKIADLDFWWHLKTGQIIWQQKAFQDKEIYSFTAAGRPYVDHEWLFQVIQYALYSNGGALAVILFKCALLSAAYLLVARHLIRLGSGYLPALILLSLSICAGRPRFIERPEIFTALFLVIVYLLIDSSLRSGKGKRLWWILPVIVVWSNIHAAVILGLVVEFAFLAGIATERFLSKSGYGVWYPESGRVVASLAVVSLLSIVVTGINPCGYQVLQVPFQLTSIIDSGLLKNQEWQQPSPLQLPFFYICALAGLFLHAINFRKLHVTGFLLTAFFAYISLKYVRNIGLFAILMPLLVAPYLSEVRTRLSEYRLILMMAAGVLLFFILWRSPFEFGTGQASYFPEQMVRFTRDQNLQGHMLNSYAFGGYLIWRLYPERKVFIDGRNEVYLPLIKRVVESRADSRKWKKLLGDYQIEYALLNYVDQLEELKIMQKDGTFVTTYAPFSSTHFPRSAWALVYWDDDGMVLIKRNGSNQNLMPLEYTSVFPEGAYYEQSLARAGRINVDKAIEELNRKLKEDPSCSRARLLLDSLQGGL